MSSPIRLSPDGHWPRRPGKEPQPRHFLELDVFQPGSQPQDSPRHSHHGSRGERSQLEPCRNRQAPRISIKIECGGVNIMLQRYWVLDLTKGEYVGEPEDREKWARRRLREIAKSQGRQELEFEVEPEGNH